MAQVPCRGVETQNWILFSNCISRVVSSREHGSKSKIRAGVLVFRCVPASSRGQRKTKRELDILSCRSNVLTRNENCWRESLSRDRKLEGGYFVFNSPWLPTPVHGNLPKKSFQFSVDAPVHRKLLPFTGYRQQTRNRSMDIVVMLKC